MVIWGLAKTAVVPLSIRSFEYYLTIVEFCVLYKFWINRELDIGRLPIDILPQKVAITAGS